jgi:hypothetical protein
LCDVTRMLEASWDSDNAIAYSEMGKGIMRISASGGMPETLIAAEKEAFYHPGFCRVESRCFLSLAPTKDIGLENNIFAVPFDPDSLQISNSNLHLLGHYPPVFELDVLEFRRDL